MESKQAKEEGMPALSKKGKWKRARCHQKMPAQQFSHYSKMPGQDGRQTCNACRDLVVPLSCPCRASDSKRLPGLAHNVCNLCAKGFAFAKFSAKRGKRSPRTCALERKKPPLQPISQKQQKRTLSRSNKYHITNVCLPSLRQSYKIHNSYRRSANTRTLRMTVSCQEWCSM